MKRKTLLVVAGVAVAGVVGWGVFGPSSVDVAVITSVAADGTVEWVEGEIVKAEENNSRVRELPGAQRHVSRLADDVKIRTAMGCGEPAGLHLSFSGLGTVECTREQFLAMPSPPYAPKLYFDGEGRIVEVAGRYHP